MQVEVVRSARRRKTVAAREVDGVLRVSIPASMSAAEAAEWVSLMVGRMQRRCQAATIDLHRRAELLAERHGLRRPASIRWVDNQHARWGSCTPSIRSIRISSRLAREPGWVLDYVIVHELAHLEVDDHGPRFWSLVRRYPQAERAIGFLIARSRDTGSDASADGPDPVDDGPDADRDAPGNGCVTPCRLNGS